MKKKRITKLILKKEQVSKLTTLDLKGGFIAGSECPDTCSCDCSDPCFTVNMPSCDGEETYCKPCYSDER